MHCSLNSHQHSPSFQGSLSSHKWPCSACGKDKHLFLSLASWPIATLPAKGPQMSANTELYVRFPRLLFNLYPDHGISKQKSKQFFPCSGGPKFTVSSIWLKSAGCLGLLLLLGSQERNVISCDFHLQVLAHSVSVSTVTSTSLQSMLNLPLLPALFKRCLSLHIEMNKIIIYFLWIDHTLSSLVKSLFISVWTLCSVLGIFFMSGYNLLLSI